jgi:hypothetical protein
VLNLLLQVNEISNSCNIGLGTGVVSVSTQNSSRYVLQNIVIKSSKCEVNSDPQKKVELVKIDNDKNWNWIKENWG